MSLSNAYLDTSQTINIGSNPNDGTGDTIRAAMTKVNYTFANIQTFLLTTTNFTTANVYQSLYALSANIPSLITSNIVITGNSSVGSTQANTGALAVNGGTSLNGNVYIPAGSTLYVGGSPVATSAATFTGGNVPGTVVFQNTQGAVSPSSAAVVVDGGLGVVGSIMSNSAITANSTITGASIVSNSTVTGTLVTASQPNVTSVGTLTSLAVSGVVTFAGGIVTSTVSAAGAMTATGSVTASGGLYGTIQTASQPLITQVGALTATSLNNTPIGASTPSSGVFTTANATTVNATTLNSTNAYITNLYVAGNTTTVNSTSVATNDLNLVLANNASTTSAAQGAGIIIGGANVAVLYNSATNSLQPNVAIIPSANITYALGSSTNQWSTTYSGTYYASQTILPSANVSVNIGSTSAWFNNIYGTSVHALYADLAEIYTTDSEYAPGTVVVFGGDSEITVTSTFADTRVAGAISTDPAYLMNEGATGLPVALRGRIPCQVVGPVTKGDLLVTSDTPGYAASVGTDRTYGPCVFAKALTTDLSEGTKIIEVVII